MTVNYKLQIDLSKGLIEAEGDKDFVLHVYQDFKDSVASAKNLSNETSTVMIEDDSNKPGARPTKLKAKKSTGASTKESLTALPEFLNGEDGKQFLREVKLHEIPNAHSKKITLFVYLMQKKLHMNGLGIQHIFTCYKLADQKTPASSLRQAITDTKNQKGWLIVDS